MYRIVSYRVVSYRIVQYRERAHTSRLPIPFIVVVVQAKQTNVSLSFARLPRNGKMGTQLKGTAAPHGVSIRNQSLLLKRPRPRCGAQRGTGEREVELELGQSIAFYSSEILVCVYVDANIKTKSLLFANLMPCMNCLHSTAQHSSASSKHFPS